MSDSGVITVQQFRAQFPSFANTTTYPNSLIQLWLDTAQGPVGGTEVPGMGPIFDWTRFGQYYPLAIMLWVAHQLTITQMMANAALAGQPVTFGPFPATSKSVNGVSVGYDSSFGQEYQAGWYGSTIWGNQLIYYIRLAGAGPIQL